MSLEILQNQDLLLQSLFRCYGSLNFVMEKAELFFRQKMNIEIRATKWFTDGHCVAELNTVSCFQRNTVLAGKESS